MDGVKSSEVWVDKSRRKITQKLPVCLPFRTGLQRETGGNSCIRIVNQRSLDIAMIFNWLTLQSQYFLHLSWYFKAYFVSFSLPLWIFKLHCVLNEAITTGGDDKGCPCLDAVFNHHVCCHTTCMQSHLSVKNKQTNKQILYSNILNTIPLQHFLVDWVT